MSCSRIFSFIKGEKDFLITARNYLLLSISISREGIYLGLYFFILITVKVLVFLLMYRNEWCLSTVRLQFYCLHNTGPGNDSAKKFSLLVSVLSWVLNNTEKWSKNFIQCILFIFFWIFFFRNSSIWKKNNNPRVGKKYNDEKKNKRKITREISKMRNIKRRKKDLFQSYYRMKSIQVYNKIVQKQFWLRN